VAVNRQRRVAQAPSFGIAFDGRPALHWAGTTPGLAGSGSLTEEVDAGLELAAWSATGCIAAGPQRHTQNYLVKPESPGLAVTLMMRTAENSRQPEAFDKLFVA